MKPYQEGVAKAQPFEDRARQLLARGDLSGAEKACREALRLHPRFIKEGDSWLLQLLGEIQLAQGKPKEALASLLPCYKTGGASADDLRLDTALAYVKLGDLPNAQRYFKGDALERHLSKGLLAGLPQGRTVRDMEALIRFAQAIEHERHADSQGALPLFLEAERLNPANRTFILGAGNALMNAGRYGEAANRYSKLASGGDDAARQAKTKLETLPATSRQAKA